MAKHYDIPQNNGILAIARPVTSWPGAPYVEIVELTDDMRAFFAAIKQGQSA